MWQGLSRRNKKQARTGVAVDGDYYGVVRVEQRGGGLPVLAAETVFRAPAVGPADGGSSSSINLSSPPASSVLEHGDYQLQMVETPSVPEAELRQAVGWQVKDLIDFPIADAAVDIFHLPRHSNSGARAIAYAVLARNDDVESAQASVEDAGITGLDTLDIPELCLRNIASMLPDEEHGAALLHFTENDGFLTITRDGVMHVARHIPSGRKIFTENADDEFFISERAAGIALEVQRSLDYYESHYDYRPINQLVLGPGSGLQALKSLLQENLGLEVTQLDLAELFEMDDDIDLETQGRCFIAAGAAMRPAPTENPKEAPVQRINMLAPEESLPVGELPARFLVQAAAAVMAVMAMLFFYADYRVAGLEDEMVVAVQQEATAVQRLGEVHASFEAITGHQGWQDQLDDALQELKQRQAMLTLVQGSTLGETRGFSPHLRALARQNIDGVWLTYISLSAGGDQTRIEGQTIGPELIPLYVQDLIVQGPFSRQRFHQFEIDNPVDNDTGAMFFSMDSASQEEVSRGGRK